MTERLSARQRAAARKRYLDHPELSVETLAGVYGVGYTTMYRVLADVTRPAGGRKKGTLSTEQMTRMYRVDGLTLSEIGKQAGLTVSGVLRRIQRAEAKK